MGYSWDQNLKKKKTHLIELDVRKPLVVSFSQRSEALKLYSLA
jgi:hypothetical protein